MHPLRRDRHFAKSRIAFDDREASNDFERRGLLGLSVTLPSIPIVGPVVTPLLDGANPIPTPAVPTQPPPQVPTQPAPTPASDSNHGGGNLPANGGNGDGGGSTSTTRTSGGNNSAPNPSPNASPDSSTPPSNPGSPDSNPPDTSPNQGSPGSNPSYSSPAPEVPGSDPSVSPTPSSTSGSSPSQSSGTSKNGSVQLSGSNEQVSGSGDDSGGSNVHGGVVITTISGMRTTITQQPHPTSGNSGNDPTGGGGSGPTGGGGNGANSSGGGGGVGPGVIAAIVICIVLVLALLVFFLRKRAVKRRAVRHTRYVSSGENGRRTTFRSSFGDLRASTFGWNSEVGHDDSNTNRHSGPFSDSKRYSGPFSDCMAVSAPVSSLTSPGPSAPEMTQIANTEITPPAIAVHSTGRRSSRNSLISTSSSASGESDDSGVQWVELRPEHRQNGGLSPSDQWVLPSPISVRPFTPTESWSFPKPPTSRGPSMVYSGENKGSVDPNPFSDPVPQPPIPIGSSPGKTITRTFEPKAPDELAVEVGDEVAVLRMFDDGWGRVKMLKRSGSMRSVQGLEGFIPIDCLRPKGSKDPLFVDANTESDYTRQVDV